MSHLSPEHQPRDAFTSSLSPSTRSRLRGSWPNIAAFLLSLLAFSPIATAEAQSSTSAPSSPRQARPEAGTARTLSLELVNAELRPLLHALAERGNFNVVLAPEVAGTISLSLREIPLRDAFRAILKAGRLRSEQIGDIIFVTRIPPTRPIEPISTGH